MTTQTAVCACQESPVVAIQKDRDAFLSKWGVFTWLSTIFMAFVTGGTWIGFVAGWHWEDILHPGFRCSQCGTDIPETQFR